MKVKSTTEWEPSRSSSDLVFFSPWMDRDTDCFFSLFIRLDHILNLNLEFFFLWLYTTINFGSDFQTDNIMIKFLVYGWKFKQFFLYSWVCSFIYISLNFNLDPFYTFSFISWLFLNLIISWPLNSYKYPFCIWVWRNI